MGKTTDRLVGLRVLTEVQLRLAARLVAALGELGIPHVFMKGSAARFCAYPDPSLRVGKDLDLAVPYGDLRAAEAAAIGLGFQPAEWDYGTRHFHAPDMRSAGQSRISTTSSAFLRDGRG